MLHVNVQPSRRRPPTGEANPAVYTQGQVSQQLGILHRSIAWQLGYIRELIQQPAFAFPPPLPGFNCRKRRFLAGTDAVDILARWQRAAVDDWFARQLPPGAQAAAVAIEQDRDAAALDASADALAERLSLRRMG